MTDTQEYPWIKHYPKGVPATINPDIYESLPDFQEKICQEYGDAPVFTSLGKTMTYKEFDEKVTAFASYLQSLPGVEQGDRVAVMMPNLLQYPICLFGIMKAGLIVVNVNPLYTARELGGQLKDSGAKVLVIIENFAKTFEKIQKDSPVEHVITTQVGDLLSAPKRLLVNFMLKKVKKMVPEFNLEYAVSSATHSPKALPENLIRSSSTAMTSHFCSTQAAQPALPKAPCSRTAMCWPTCSRRVFGFPATSRRRPKSL